MLLFRRISLTIAEETVRGLRGTVTRLDNGQNNGFSSVANTVYLQTVLIRREHNVFSHMA